MEEKENIPESRPENNSGEEKLYSERELKELIGKETEELKNKLLETEKLARMDAEEKVKYSREMAEKRLREREIAVAKRELMATAIEKLSEADLPKGLAACLNYESEESCIESISAVSEAFREAVSEAVNRRLKGNAPKLISSTGKDAFLDGLGIE